VPTAAYPPDGPSRASRARGATRDVDAAALTDEVGGPWDIGAAHGLQAYPFDSGRFPWSAVGRVEVEGGWASGALVGPRHVLTASHVVVWPDDDVPHEAGWLRFTPAASEASAPFGHADAVAVHFLRPVRPPSIGAQDDRVDYAVVVLDRPIGQAAGWLGVQSFTQAWNGKAVWSLVGYRGTTARATRPFFTGGVWMVVHEEHEADSHVIFHLAGVTVGQSGGPVIGQWPGHDGPTVVAVQSWANEFVSGASGGDRLVDLVRTARELHP
jgi:V8-like Glu-specific endopeptidase